MRAVESHRCCIATHCRIWQHAGVRFNGFAIRALRRERRLTVSALAELSGIKQPHLSLIEKGERQPSWEVAQRLAWALGLDDLRAILVNPGPDFLTVQLPEAVA